MSKMSNIHLELTEQAAELGFESIEQAEANGYKVDYTGEGWVLKPDVNKAYEDKHKVWLKERDHALEILDLVADVLNEINDGLIKTGDKELVEAWSLMELSRETRDIARFIKEQCHD